MAKNGWKEMESAPKDGTQILVCRNNGCSWEYDVVFWSDRDRVYPWCSGLDDGYAEGRLDYWRPHPTPPYEITF